ncbi:MAG: archaellin/type IV pilin N-terminal domain-containing protein [Candidatus Heimdallarchaeota archaeon]
MIKRIKRMYMRRKAVSPVLAAILLIAITVAAIAVIYFLIVPLFNTYKLKGELYIVSDTNKDSMYDQIGLQLTNYVTKTINVTKITVWTCIFVDLGNQSNWVEHLDWVFTNPAQSVITASSIDEVTIDGEDQISLSAYTETYYRLEIVYTGAANPFYSDWEKLNEFADLGDLLIDFDSFNLTALGFTGSIDDPDANPQNNYLTDASGDYQLINESLNLLPVLDELELIPFYVANALVAFHTDNDPTMDDNPLQQVLALDNPLRASKFFILGLAGSWGDEFPVSAWALNMTFVYTDGSTEEFMLGHSYIDDWYYTSNDPNGCVSVPYGDITEIDLGMQTFDPSPHHIHTHTTRFYFDYFKYLDTIIFTDPGNDDSAPHLISLTLG